MSCLYILEMNPLSVASFANIFSYSECCLFILFIVSFAVQKLLSLIRSHLFIFVFILITLGDGWKKVLLRFMSKSVLPMFSSKSFIVSGLIFRSLIHLEFIFVYGVWKCSNFILLHVAVQFSQHHLLKRLSFKNMEQASLVAQWLRIRLPMQETQVWALVREDPTCRGATKPIHHNYWACALEPVNHNYWACMPQLLKPVHLEPMLCNKRSHRNKKPVHLNEEQPLLAATRESPRAATKTQHSQK